MKLLNTTIKYAIVLIALLVPASYAQNVKTYIPKNAYALLDPIREEAMRFAPEIDNIAYFPALYEHESCISLTHSKCMNPASEYKRYDKNTKVLVEQGVGLGQTTRAYRANGQLRFDTLANMKKIYRTHLAELTWDNIKTRPDLQIRIGILLTMENYRALSAIHDPTERLYMTDAAYNGGLKDLHQERTLCGLKPGCDPQIWFGNVESIVYKSTAKIHNGRSSYEVNRHHVKDVFFNRMPKYTLYYKDNPLVKQVEEPIIEEAPSAKEDTSITKQEPEIIPADSKESDKDSTAVRETIPQEPINIPEDTVENLHVDSAADAKEYPQAPVVNEYSPQEVSSKVSSPEEPISKEALVILFIIGLIGAVIVLK